MKREEALPGLLYEARPTKGPYQVRQLPYQSTLWCTTRCARPYPLVLDQRTLWCPTRCASCRSKGPTRCCWHDQEQ